MAQNRIHNTGNNGWYMYFGNHRLSEKLSLHTEYQWRRADLISSWQQSLCRIGLDYTFPEHYVLTAGYGFIRTWPYGAQPVPYIFDEHRAWQQFIINQAAGRIRFNHRYRMEERWLENKTENDPGNYLPDGFVYRNRIRYRLMLTFPLVNKSQTEGGKWFLSAYNEFFISFGKNVPKNIFDQNRSYAALGFAFSKNTNIQLGYLYHIILKSDAVHAESNHTLQLALTHNLDFSRQQ